MIEEIIERLHQDHYEVSKNDLIIIDKLPSLKKMLVQGIVENRISIKIIINDLIFEEYTEYIPEDKKKEFYINYYTELFTTSGIIDEYCYDNIYSITKEMSGLSKDEIDEVMNEANRRIQNPNEYPSELFPSQSFDDLNNEHYLLKLLDYKRYDILEKKVLHKNSLTEETYKRFISEYPFDKYKTPYFLYPYLIKNNMYPFSLNDYFKYIDQDFNTLINILKAKSNEEIEKSDISKMFIQYRRVTTKEKEEVIRLLLERNILLYTNEINDIELEKEYIKLIETKIINNEEVDPKIIKDYYHKIKDEKCIDIINSSKYLLYVSAFGLDYDALRNIDFENEEIDISNISAETLEEMPLDVFNKLINSPSLKGEMSLDYYEDILSKERLIALLSSNIKFKEIEYSKILFEREIIETIVNHNLYDKIVNQYNFRRNVKTLIVYPDLTIKYLKENYSETPKFILDNFPEIMESKEIMDFIFSSNYHISILLDTIEHRTEDYSEELFQNVKEYLSEEYDIPLHKIELLEAKVGPAIVKDIKNENIQKILSLSDENLEKVIAIFPDSHYSLSDMNSTYDSIIQYYYSKKRIEEYEIFHSICEAIQENDITTLNVLKCSILGLITEEEYKIIAEQNKLLYPSLNSCLDILFAEIASGNDVQNNLDKLHEITNQYILKSRQEFRSNHYYIDDQDYLDFQYILNKIADDDCQDIIDILKDEYSDVLIEIIRKYNLKEYKEVEEEKIVETLFEHIKNGMKGNDEYNLNMNIKLLKKMVDKNNEQIKRINPETLESHLSLPFRFEKKTLSRFIDKNALGNIRLYKVDGAPLLNEIVRVLEKQNISKYAIIQALNYYSNDTPVPSLETLKDKINLFLYRTMINKTTGEKERHDINYFINHPEEIDNYLIKTGSNIIDITFPKKDDSINNIEDRSNLTELSEFILFDGLSFKDCLYAIISNQTEEKYIKSIIGSIVGEYKKLEKADKIKSRYNRTPKEETYLTILSRASEIFVIDKSVPIPIREYIKKKLSKKISKDEINALFFSSFGKGDIYKEIYDIIDELIEKGLLFFIEPSMSYQDIFFESIKKEKAKRKYETVLPENRILDIMKELDVDLLIKTILSDKKIYEKLIQVMNKKKLHIVPDEILDEMEILDLPVVMTPANVAGFISYFKTILEEDPMNMSFIKLVIQGELYSGVSQIYKQILGPKDANLIKENSGPNQASRKTKNNERLDEAVNQTIRNFKRSTITIPPFDENVEIKGKRINIIVGNFTDTTNLTHGERTGSCMRIGGVGESLFNFTLNNENGFHIRFEDSETGEYISRVSGFRNGNTVFLNELRNSCSERFDEIEIIEACKKAAQKLIEKSKNSPCPIENVVITGDYAMAHESQKNISLGINSSKEGLPNFYSDIDADGIVLATTSTENPFKKIDFDKSKVPTYRPQRGKIYRSNDRYIMESKIARVATVKKIIEGLPFQEMGSMSFDDGFKYGIVSDDWYVYIDSNGKIIYDIIDIDPRAKNELSNAIEEVKSMLDIYTLTEEEMKDEPNKNR